MAIRRIKRFAKKAYNSRIAKTIRKATGNRYGRTRKQLLNKGIPRLYKDVMMIKNMVNDEKKVYEQTYTATVGQCNINADTGYYAVDITPIPSQGVTATTRNGASIKLNSMVFRGQATQQTNLNTDLKFTIYIIRTVGQTQTVDSTLVNKFLIADVLTTCTDHNSNRNQNYFRDFRVVAKRTFKILNDSASSQNQLKDFSIPLRIKQHVRYAQDTTNVTQNQLWMLILADTGNINSSTASTLSNIANKTALTGCTLALYQKTFYYDN